jgi:hypothetical protein
MCLANPNWLAQVVRALVLVAFPLGLRFESFLVQTIYWGQPAGKTGVSLDLYGGSVLHRSEVYSTGVGTRSALPLRVPHH